MNVFLHLFLSLEAFSVGPLLSGHRQDFENRILKFPVYEITLLNNIWLRWNSSLCDYKNQSCLPCSYCEKPVYVLPNEFDKVNNTTLNGPLVGKRRTSLDDVCMQLICPPFNQLLSVTLVGLICFSVLFSVLVVVWKWLSEVSKEGPEREKNALTEWCSVGMQGSESFWDLLID